MKRTLALSLVASLTLAAPAIAQQVTGSVIVARAGANALVLWDATQAVVDAGNAQTPGDKALIALEQTALRALRDKSAVLPHSSKLTIRVLYDRTGAVSAVYHIATMEGTEHVFDLSVPRAVLLSKFDALEAEIAAGKIAPPLVLDMTGKLP